LEEDAVARVGDVVEVPELGLRFEFRHTAQETGGEYSEVEVVGRPRGMIRLMHVHAGQSERFEVLEGILDVKMRGRTHVVRPGEAIEIPPDTPHLQRPGGAGPGRLRVTYRPSGHIDELIERFGELSRTARFNRFGFPRPLAGAALVSDLGEAGYAARPPLRVQKAAARALLRVARPRPYEFVDEWDVDAPAEAVFDVLSDATTYPQWWRPVYLGVESDGPPAVGNVTRQHFKGRLPYHLRTRTRTVRLERPRVIEGETDGDLRGRGVWTLDALPGGGTHVRFDWSVHADRALLRVLTPVLRPALRWNHNWAIARAIEGLEPYARSRA
jgi:mannose-6-phosphate isomerase-like protein (cupin superfamily)